MEGGFLPHPVAPSGSSGAALARLLSPRPEVALSVPAAEFEAAVDALPVPKQDDDPEKNIGVAEDFAAAKEAVKALAKRVTRPYVGANIGGHCLQPGQDGYSESVNARVYGSATPPAA